MPNQEMHTATDEETYELASFIGWIIVNMIFNIAISAIIINEHGNVIENEDKIPLEKEKKMLDYLFIIYNYNNGKRNGENQENYRVENKIKYTLKYY